jgi:hypothetical protein
MPAIVMVGGTHLATNEAVYYRRENKDQRESKIK